MEVVVSGTFKLFFDYSILNVYVLIQNLDVDNLLQAFIWYPYDGQSCSNILSYNNLEIIDECETLNDTRDDENKFQLRELIAELPSRLPDKFHQCPLILQVRITQLPLIINLKLFPLRLRYGSLLFSALMKPSQMVLKCCLLKQSPRSWT